MGAVTGISYRVHICDSQPLFYFWYHAVCGTSDHISGILYGLFQSGSLLWDISFDEIIQTLNDWISEEDIPDGDRFDATATFSFSRGCFVFTFKSDGTYVEELTTNVSDEPVSSDGTYTRDGSFIYLTKLFFSL